jgi:hypothetical protein
MVLFSFRVNVRKTPVPNFVVFLVGTFKVTSLLLLLCYHVSGLVFLWNTCLSVASIGGMDLSYLMEMFLRPEFSKDALTKTWIFCCFKTVGLSHSGDSFDWRFCSSEKYCSRGRVVERIEKLKKEKNMRFLNENLTRNVKRNVIVYQLWRIGKNVRLLTNGRVPRPGRPCTVKK